MSEPVKISLCVITLNEADNLNDCLASAAWADERLVVDSGSTDSTLEIAGRHGCRILHQDFLGHVKQKEFAVRSAAHEWVLCLDADERLQEGAEQEIRAVLAAPACREESGYFFPRHTFYLGGWINHGGWWPEYRLRLFNRDRGGWTGIDPHDRVEVQGGTRRLKSEIIHFNYRDLSHHMEKVNAYTSIMADRRFKAGKSASLVKMVFNPFGRFLRMYFLRRGFLDGRKGFVIAVIGAFYVFLKYAKLWERHKYR
ncbi:MAG: glycosyltransferase family 2 protein [Planctomycetota bacterium]